jgi:hypothetical protein
MLPYGHQPFQQLSTRCEMLQYSLVWEPGSHTKPSRGSPGCGSDVLPFGQQRYSRLLCLSRRAHCALPEGSPGRFSRCCEIIPCVLATLGRPAGVRACTRCPTAQSSHYAVVKCLWDFIARVPMSDAGASAARSSDVSRGVLHERPLWLRTFTPTIWSDRLVRQRKWPSTRSNRAHAVTET